MDLYFRQLFLCDCVHARDINSDVWSLYSYEYRRVSPTTASHRSLRPRQPHSQQIRTPNNQTTIIPSPNPPPKKTTTPLSTCDLSPTHNRDTDAGANPSTMLFISNSARRYTCQHNGRGERTTARQRPMWPWQQNESLFVCVFIFSLFIFICLFNCRSRSGFVVAMVVGMWHDLSPLGVPLGRARARGQG